jgi:hypothetical protein
MYADTDSLHSKLNEFLFVSLSPPPGENAAPPLPYPKTFHDGMNNKQEVGALTVSARLLYGTYTCCTYVPCLHIYHILLYRCLSVRFFVRSFLLSARLYFYLSSYLFISSSHLESSHSFSVLSFFLSCSVEGIIYYSDHCHAASRYLSDDT